MIGSVYDYYLTTYAGTNAFKSTSTHKKSELRDIYNNIVRINRKSPLYKFDMTEDLQKYAIDLKEGAYSLKDIAGSLNTDSLISFSNKKAHSSNPEKVSATYIKSDSQNTDDSEFDIKINHLAAPQINTGNYLSPNNISIPYGNYSFDINVDEYSYELQFKVTESETNRSLQEKLSRLINRSDIGVNADIVENPSGKTALRITSGSTGQSFKPRIFSLSNNDNNLKDIVNYLGLNQLTTAPSNASFSINNIEKTASSNTFTINKCFEINLNSVTEDEPVHIGFKPDSDSLTDSLHDLADNYNSFVDLAFSNSDNAGDSSKLYKDLQKIVKRNRNSLESAGLSFDDSGKMTVDSSLITQSVSEGSIKDSLNVIGKFKNDIIRQSNQIALNPMQYVDKTMISYPNPVISFSNPYITSLYSGMMYNGYI